MKKHSYSNDVFGVHCDYIHRILLADNEWYEINVTIEVTDDKYFSAWCIRESDGASLRMIGSVDKILLAEAQYS
tara:strand:- start:349 stop:570 length:222 start_codon:yes stop_codon:yes gene_type:complete